MAAATTPTLRGQIVTSFLAFAAIVSLLFAGCSFVIAYVVEDALFKESIVEEAARQQEHWRSTGRLATPHRDFIRIYTDVGSLPTDLRKQFSASDVQEEYSGSSGRHYHVLPFALDDPSQAYAVAEVGSRLVVRSLRGELLLLIALVALGILLVAGALGYWLAIRATAPLSRLVRAVSHVDPGQVPQVVAADFPNNEVGTLARTLQLMLERTRAFVERETRFTRDASHELRTPLAVIKSSVELIDAKGGMAGNLSKPLTRIADATRQMEQSVDVLLLLAREERAQSPREDLPLLPLVERVVIAESDRHRAASFTVCVEIPADSKCMFNEAVASTVLSNLIGNAFRHNTASKVLITVDGEDVVIQDTGQGIPEDVLTSLQDGDTEARMGRPGLGLSIVLRLCRVHSIAFNIKSSPAGTTARIGLLRAAGDAG